MAIIQNNEPISVRAGDTWQWRRDDLVNTYPASSWTLKYFFRNGTNKFDVTAIADGEAFSVSVANATSATISVGSYDWIAVAESVTERFEVDNGRLEVKQNLAVDVVADGRSFARRMVDAIEATLFGRATAGELDLVNAQMADRQIARDKSGLIALREQFLAEVRKEDAEQKGIKQSRLYIRFRQA